MGETSPLRRLCTGSAPAPRRMRTAPPFTVLARPVGSEHSSIVEGGETEPERETSKETDAGGPKVRATSGQPETAKDQGSRPEEEGDGATRRRRPKGATFNAGPTRTWVRGRSSGRPG